MRFVVAMAWREIRASWRQLILFFACVALGVGAMVSLRSFTHVVSESLSDDARVLLGGDVRVESNDPWTAAQQEMLARQGADPRVTGSTRMLDTDTMVRAESSGETRPLMAAVRGVDSTFPLRGSVRLASGARYDYAMLARHGIVVTASFVERLRLRTGSRVLIGGAPFTIRDVMVRLPGNSLNFSPVPRVLMRADDVAALGLTGFGSRVVYSWLFATRGDEGNIANEIAGDNGAGRIRSIATFHWIERWLVQSLSNIDGFLSLIGLSIVVLGGIGVASVTRVFVQQRLRTIAILKCLGGRTRKVLGAYLAQVFALSLAGAVVRLLVAQAITSGVAGYASRRLPLDVEPRLSALACAQGAAVGVLIALLFALPPLLDIRDVKPILVLRDEAGRRRRVDWLKIGAQCLIAGAIAALAGWQAGTCRNAGLFVGGIFAAAAILHGMAAVVMAGLARMRMPRSFAVRQGVRSLFRPGNQTRVTLFTVGLGALFVVAVRVFQVNVQSEYSLDLTNLAADMFFIDVLPADHDGVMATLTGLGATDVQLLPVAHGRLVGVRRSPSNPNRVGRDRFGGEFRMTGKPSLDAHEVLDAGRFWPASPSSQPEVSVEKGYADWLRLQIGDVLVFDVAGTRLEAPVTSIRTYDRRVRSFSSLVRTDFMFRPGSLERLPHSFVGAAKGPAGVSARAAVQNAFVAAFPGVTFLDALDEIQEVRTRVNDVSAAVSAIGGFVIACGILILVGAVAMTRIHRLYEAAIFRTLGATRRVLVRITVVEYAILGVLAGLVGSLAAIAVTWVVSRFGRPPLPWHVRPWITAAGIVSTTFIVIIVGVLAAASVIARKPMAVLRER